MSGNEKREREMLQTPLSEESTTQKKSKLKMPFLEAKITQKFKVLTLFFWCSEECGSLISKGAPKEPKEVQPTHTTRGGGRSSKCIIPTFGINLAGHTEDDKHFIPFAPVDATRNPGLIEETTDTGAKMAKQSGLIINHCIPLIVDVPLEFIGENVSVSAYGWGGYTEKDIPFVLLNPEDEPVFRSTFVKQNAGCWWVGNIVEPNLDELGVFDNKPNARAEDNDRRFPFKLSGTFGHVKKEGKVASRDYVQGRSNNPTVVQYGPPGKGPGVEKGHFDMYRLFLCMPPADEFLLAEECTVCQESSTDMAEMFAVAPCRHVNVCKQCYDAMIAMKTKHAYKCAICRCERPEGAAGEGGFVK